MSNAEQQKEVILFGVIEEALPNTMFRIALKEPYIVEGKEPLTNLIAYLGGKMKFHRIRVMIGDTVEVLIDPYGGRGRIVKRK